jgi:signal transduction histidine kinase
VSLGCENGAALLEIEDTGIGIGPEDQRRLFERFFRAESAVERQLPGTGLGLYISRVIAEAHRGSLSVRSELGRGSTFRLELPLVPVAVRV